MILDTTGWGEGKINALGTYGTMQGAKLFIVGIIRRGEHDMEDFGYQFEKVILRATDLGLGTCWIGGIFNRSRFADKAGVREDEVLPAVSPLGYPRQKRSVTVLLFDSSSRWFSRDYGQTWKESVPLEPASDGKPWYTWDPPLVERDAKTGKVTRLVETGYTWFRPPEVRTAHQQAYLRFSTDGGKSWGQSLKVPQWEAVSEVALLRAANGHLVAACRTDTPARMQPEIIDHTEGLGISISTEDGRTWSEVRKLYDWGRHHPSMILLPSGEIAMTYVVRKGYVNTPQGFPQFGIEAVVSRDHGQTWDLDHKYILHHWIGHIKDGPTAWYPSSQATSTVLLPDGSILTAFGTGYRCQDIVKGQPAPRDVGLVRWRLNTAALNTEAKLRNAPFDSDLRNVYDPARH